MGTATLENLAIERLTALVAAGYEIDHISQASDAVRLNHPSRKLKHWCAYVYSSGQAVFPVNANEEIRFYADDPQEGFYAFVRNVPKPHWTRAYVRVRGLIFCIWMMATTYLAAYWIGGLTD